MKNLLCNILGNFERSFFSASEQHFSDISQNLQFIFDNKWTASHSWSCIIFYIYANFISFKDCSLYHTAPMIIIPITTGFSHNRYSTG